MGAEQLDDFGSSLRAARERKGMSLRDIASHTKISVAALDALERNDISRLPGGIFSRAFVRSYAAEVGLDPEQTIQDFILHFPHESVIAGHPRSDRVEDTELFESDRRAASSALWILGASVVLAGGVLLLSVARDDAPIPEPVPTSAPASDAAAAGPPLAPAATTGTDRPIVEGASAPAVAAPAPAQPEAAVAASGPAAETSGLTIVLAARRPVWISATVDGQKALGRLLQPGEQETVAVSREMVLTAGDAAAIRMTLNGAEARAIGKTGEVVTARVTLANFREYLAAR